MATSHCHDSFWVVGIGELLWDMLPTGKQLGGAPTNFAYHANALGATAVVASCIGDDPLGHEILSRLESLKLNCEYIATDSSHPTGTVDVKLDSHGIPDFTIHQNVAWDFIPTTPSLLQLAARADAVCFGSLAQRSPVSRNTIQQFLRATSPNCLRIFDINLRQTYYTLEVIEQSLRLSHVLKLNDQELPILSRLLQLDADEHTAINQLTRQFSLRAVALTRGPAGSRLYIDDHVHEHPGHPATIADTVGAGDAFTAALTLGLLRNQDPSHINDFANRLAAYVCSQPGATPPIPADLLR